MESQKPNSEARGVAKVRVESGGRSWRLNFKEAPIVGEHLIGKQLRSYVTRIAFSERYLMIKSSSYIGSYYMPQMRLRELLSIDIENVNNLEEHMSKRTV